MRTSMMLAALVSLSFAACVDDTTYGGDALPGKTVQKAICPTGCSDDIESGIDGGEWAQLTENSFINLHTATAAQGTSRCNAEQLTGGCAFACEPSKFISSIPAGSCAALRCEFSDGTEIMMGGCN